MSLATHCIPWDADCSLCNPPAAVAPPSAPPEPTKPYDGYEGWCVVARITTVVGDAFYCQKHEAVWSARDDPPASCRDNGWITPKRLAFMRELHQAPAVSLPEPTLTREQVEALLAAGHVEGPYIPTYTTASGGPPETTAPTATWMTAVLQSRALTDDELDTAARKLVETLHGERRDDVAAGCVAELRSRWWSLVSPHRQPVASSATPEVTFTPVRVPHLPQIESSVASSATPTPARSFEEVERMIARVNASGQTLAAALASSQQEVERLRAALLAVFNRWGFMDHDADCKVGQSGVQLDCNCRRLALTETVRALTTEPR